MTWLDWRYGTNRPDVATTPGPPPVPCPTCSPAFAAMADNDEQLRDLNQRLYADIRELRRDLAAANARLERGTT